jgi:hypothetical protein
MPCSHGKVVAASGMSPVIWPCPTGNLLRLGGRAWSHRPVRRRQHLIRCGDPFAELVIDQVENAEHVGRLTITIPVA